MEAGIAAIEYYQVHAESITEEDIAEGIRAIIPSEKSHAVNLKKRIRELGGEPIDPAFDAVKAGRKMGEESKKQGTVGMLQLELQNEQQAIKDYAIPEAEIIDDFETIELLKEQVFNEMRYAKWL